jgi:hypothetical protein
MSALAEEQASDAEVEAALAAAANEADVAAFLATAEGPRIADPDWIAEPRIVLTAARRVKDWPHHGRDLAFILKRNLTTADTDDLVDLIESTTDRQVLLLCLSLLRLMYKSAPFTPRLLRLAHDGDWDVAEAAIAAMRHMAAPGIRELALTLISAGNAEAVSLLEQNFAPGDFAAIEAALPKWRNDDDVHRAGLGILAVTRDELTAQGVTCLAWVYENTPCADCREFAVARLIELGALTRDVLEECRDDCHSDTRELVGSSALGAGQVGEGDAIGK